MKKNILKVAFVAAIAMATGIQVFNAQKSEALSEVAMANVEALAADDDFTDLCVRRPNSECYELIVTPSGSECLIWFDMVNIIF